MISIGLTVEHDKLPTVDAARAILDGAIEAILEERENIDFTGSWDYYLDGVDPEAPDYEEGLRSEVLDHLINGYGWLVNNGNEQAWFAIPGVQYRFITSGGMTHGDSPFDEYDDVVQLMCTVDAIPALRRPLGILGGGIQLSYDDDETP